METSKDLISEQTISELVKKNTKYLIFLLESEYFGVEVSSIREILPVQDITIIPFTDEFVLGVTNVRSSIVSVLDIRGFFELEKLAVTDKSRIIISDIDSLVVGIIIDKVISIEDFDEEELKKTPEFVAGTFQDYTKGIIEWENNVIFILDLKRFLCSEMITKYR